MRKTLLFTAAALFIFPLLDGKVSGAAQVLTINNGSTLTVNGGILDVNCLDIMVMSGGSLLLDSGTIKGKKELLITPGGVFHNSAGRILDCSARTFYIIPNQVGGAAVITLPEN